MPRLQWGAGKDTTLAGALEAAARAAGDGRDDLYDALMAGSGAAFELHFSPEWQPGCAIPHQTSLVTRAARAAGLRADIVGPPFEPELLDLIWARLVESIDASIPALVRGLEGSGEFGIVVGYDEDGRVFFARQYGDRADTPAPHPFDRLFPTDALTIVFLDPAERPDEAALARESLRVGLAAVTETVHEEDGERYAAGEAALLEWIGALTSDVAPREAAAHAFVDHALRVGLHDARRSAARFLRHARRHFPDRIGAELIRTAEAFGYVADECEKAGVRPFDASIVARFMDSSLRRGWMHALERALARQREAVAALVGAAALVH